KRAKIAFLDVFREGRAWTSTIFWICCLLSMGNIALLAAWLPTFFQEMGGISIQRFAVVSLISFVGGLAGTVTIGYVMDRVGARSVLPVAYGCLCMVLLLMANVPFESAFFPAILISWNFFQSGGQAGLSMFMTEVYPSHIRSTGVGWAAGAGRFG